MKIKEDHSLKKYNSFGIDSKAGFFAETASCDDIELLLNDPVYRNNPNLILGRGCNILFTVDYKGLVIHPVIRGIDVAGENDDYIFLRIGAGEEWDDVVKYAVLQGWGGIENLSFIPGSVGAAPVQNIGAYGVEICHAFESLEAFDTADGKLKTYHKQECRFGYRDSIFKQQDGSRHIILYVTLKLSKRPVFITHYGKVKEELKKYGETTLQNIRDAVISIRRRMLPDPEITGNAGSFFKNPVVSSEKSHELRKKFTDIVEYGTTGEQVKISAGWLIEQCGWKGKCIGDACVFPGHALILVNMGKASGCDILNLAKAIIESVKNKFDIELIPEVNII